jgi:hypothetical protein
MTVTACPACDTAVHELRDPMGTVLRLDTVNSPRGEWAIGYDGKPYRPADGRTVRYAEHRCQTTGQETLL